MSQNKAWVALAIQYLEENMIVTDPVNDVYYRQEISRLNQLLDGGYVLSTLVCLSVKGACVGTHVWRHFDYKNLVKWYGKYFMEVHAVPRQFNGRTESCPDEEMLWFGDIGKNGMCGVALWALCKAAEEMSGKVLFYKENDDFVA